MQTILIEDTEVMNSMASVVLDGVLKQLNKKYMLLFWRSPGYEWTKDNKLPILSLSPTYIIPASKEQCEKTINQSSLKSWFEKSQNNWPQDLINRNVNDLITLQEVNSITYLSARVGQAITSLLIRTNPQVSITERAPVSMVHQLLDDVCRGVDTIAWLNAKFSIKYLFQSESVYLSYAFLDYAISNNIDVPYILSAEGPLLITKEHTCGVKEIGSSPVKKKSLNALLSEEATLFPEALESLALRIAGKKNYYEAVSIERKRVDLLSEELAKKYNINFISLLDIDQMPKYSSERSYSFVFYLHAATDGMYAHGYSGYVSPFDFFIDIASRLGDIFSKNIDVLIRPHPNLFSGQDSKYESQHIKITNEEVAYKHQLGELISTLQKSECNISIASIELSLHDLTSSQAAIHVSHHGTVLHDLYALGLPIITTAVSSLSCLDDISGCFFISPDINQRDFHAFVENNKTSAIEITHDRLAKGTQLSLYGCNYLVENIKPLHLTPYSSEIYSLTKHIYDNGYSWDLDSLIRDAPSASICLSNMVACALKILDT